MADTLTPARRSENMRRIKSKNMKPEMVVRSIAHGLGYRYRLHRRDLPGKPDLAFPARRKVIFVHGCFWHGHDDPACVDGRRQPKSNLDYWLPKLTRNRERDAAHAIALAGLGWSVLTVWECETRKTEALRQRIGGFLERRAGQNPA
jgi:DNA mismatch endonuclease (patch repair protein)